MNGAQSSALTRWFSSPRFLSTRMHAHLYAQVVQADREGSLSPYVLTSGMCTLESEPQYRFDFSPPPPQTVTQRSLRTLRLHAYVCVRGRRFRSFDWFCH